MNMYFRLYIMPHSKMYSTYTMCQVRVQAIVDLGGGRVDLGINVGVPLTEILSYNL